MVESNGHVSVARHLLDLTLGLVPVVSVGKDIYEAATGSNFVTGEELGAFDRTLSAIGVLSLGGSNIVKGPLKILEKVVAAASRKGIKSVRKGAKEAIAGAEKIADSAGKLGIKTKESLQGFTSTLKKLVGNEAGEIEVWARKFSGAKGLKGKEFEKYLAEQLGGQGAFKVGIREFDGKIGKLWYEAKTIDWSALSDPAKLGKFKSDMGRGLSVAKENDASYHLFSNTPVPDHIKTWLTEKGITFLEILE